MSLRRLAAAIVFAAFTLICADTARALDAFWHGVRSDVWGEGIASGESNWYSEAPPNGVARDVPDGTAVFASGAWMNQFNLRILQDATIGRMRFTSDAPKYSFIVARNRKLVLDGLGLTNQSGQTPVFKVLGLDGEMRLTESARLIGTGVPAARITTADLATLAFENMSRGGNAIVFNTDFGKTSFSNTSSAELMEITNQPGGNTSFIERSTGDRAHLINEQNGKFDCYQALGPNGDRKLPIGQVDNAGQMTIGRVTLQVARSYTQTSTGTLRLDLSRLTSGAIVTGGNATVGGRLVVFAQITAAPGTFKIVRVGGRLTGRFQSVVLTDAPDLKARLAYSPKEVALIIERK